MPRNAAAYDKDFYAWTQEQAGLLRAGKFAEVDVENLAEELDSMGRSDRREIDSRLEVLLAHLLKWQAQVTFRSQSWRGTIREQRRRIAKLLRESPSLQPVAEQLVPEAYEEARQKAANDTGLPEASFPAECPFTPEQVLADDFLPDQ
jgi:ribosomal protein L29